MASFGLSQTILYSLTTIQNQTHTEPTYLADFSKDHNARLSSRGIQQELTLPVAFYEKNERSFQVQGVRYWNSPPPPSPCVTFHHTTHSGATRVSHAQV